LDTAFAFRSSVKEQARTAPAFMQIDDLLRRWLDVLAATYFTWRDAWRAQRTLVIASENDRFVLRKAPPDSKGRQAVRHEEKERPVLAVVPAGQRVSEEILRTAQWSCVVLEIPNENVVVRRISVPAQAREFVAGIIRNQIDRLSPWPPDQAIYGFEADIDPQEPTALDVRVLIAGRAVIDSAREQISAIGLAVDRVVASCKPGSANGVTLWSRLADVSPEYQARMRHHIGIGIAAVISACLVLSIWAVISASLIRARSDDIATRIETLRRQLQGPATLQSAAALPPNEREWYDKETSPSAVIVIEALSRALPDSAYLTELSVQSTTLHIVGLTTDAPPLIASLEHSGSLTGVRFFAPTTREPDGKHFRFHIESHVEPHGIVAEAKQ
jgi:general secretion pathway protein L